MGLEKWDQVNLLGKNCAGLGEFKQWDWEILNQSGQEEVEQWE